MPPASTPAGASREPPVSLGPEPLRQSGCPGPKCRRRYSLRNLYMLLLLGVGLIFAVDEYAYGCDSTITITTSGYGIVRLLGRSATVDMTGTRARDLKNSSRAFAASLVRCEAFVSTITNKPLPHPISAELWLGHICHCAPTTKNKAVADTREVISLSMHWDGPAIRAMVPPNLNRGAAREFQCSMSVGSKCARKSCLVTCTRVENSWDWASFISPRTLRTSPWRDRFSLRSCSLCRVAFPASRRASPASLFSAAIVSENNSLVRASANSSVAIPTIKMIANARPSRWRFARLSSPLRTCSYSVRNSPKHPNNTMASEQYSVSSQNRSLDQRATVSVKKITAMLAHMARQRHAQIALMLGVITILALSVIQFSRVP